MNWEEAFCFILFQMNKKRFTFNDDMKLKLNKKFDIF